MNAIVKDEICRISDYQEVEGELSLLIKQDMNEWIYKKQGFSPNNSHENMVDEYVNYRGWLQKNINEFEIVY